MYLSTITLERMIVRERERKKDTVSCLFENKANIHDEIVVFVSSTKMHRNSIFVWPEGCVCIGQVSIAFALLRSGQFQYMHYLCFQIDSILNRTHTEDKLLHYYWFAFFIKTSEQKRKYVRQQREN